MIAQGHAPVNTSLPTISGTLKVGQTLTATNGSWNNGPTHYDYQWRRCDTGNNCRDVGSDRSTYVPDRGDVGRTIRVEVKARNDYGTTTATSAPTGVVAPAGLVPANTAPPAISGVPRDGQLLVATTGTWTNSPTNYAFQWLRCDTAGNNCADFGGDGQSQRLGSSEVGHTIRVTVEATNQYGTTKATSAPTAVVAGAAPGRARSRCRRSRCRSASSSPACSSSRRGSRPVVRSSPASGSPTPAGTSSTARSSTRSAFRTAGSGTRPRSSPAATAGRRSSSFPTRLMPIHRRAALVMFVRARKPGDNVLAGVSARRLVQISIR